MELTFKDCIQMQQGLAQVKQPKFSDIKDLDNKMDYLFHQDFTFAVAKNKRKLANIIEDLQSIIEPTDEFREYSTERKKILRKFASKGEDGNPKKEISRNGQESYIIPDIDNNSQFKKNTDKLEEKFKDAIKNRDDQFLKYNKKLKDNSEFNPIMVSEKNIPNGLDITAMDGVLFMTDFEE